jgi:hypothetical protein
MHEAFSLTYSGSDWMECSPQDTNATQLVQVPPTDTITFSSSCSAELPCQNYDSVTSTVLLRIPPQTSEISLSCSASTFSGDGIMVEMALGNLSLFASNPRNRLWPAGFDSNCNSSCNLEVQPETCTCTGCESKQSSNSSCPGMLDELHVFPGHWVLTGPCNVYPGGKCSLGTVHLVVPPALRHVAHFLGNLRTSTGCSASRRRTAGAHLLGDSGSFSVSCTLV